MNLLVYGESSPVVWTDDLGLVPKPPEGRWCDDQVRPCPDTCDADRLSRAVTDAQELGAAYCRMSDQPDLPREVKEGDPHTIGGIDDATDRPWFLPQGDPCRDYCLCGHEWKHLQQLQDPRVDQMLIDRIPTRQIVNRLECEAYQTSVACFRSFLGGQ